MFQLPRIIEYVRDKALKLTRDRSRGERIEVSDFPVDVIREAVVNAIVHRDYNIEGATNYLCIDPERIIVRSPGERPFKYERLALDIRTVGSGKTYQ